MNLRVSTVYVASGPTTAQQGSTHTLIKQEAGEVLGSHHPRNLVCAIPCPHKTDKISHQQDFATNVMMVVSILQELRHRVLDSNHIHEIRTIVTQLCAQVVFSWKNQWALSICPVNPQESSPRKKLPHHLPFVAPHRSMQCFKHSFFTLQASGHGRCPLGYGLYQFTSSSSTTPEAL
jgi:hypothetical protein